MRVILWLLAITLLFPNSANASGLPTARVDYMLNCAGCHGMQGDAGAARVPRLSGRIGRLLCSGESRAYVIRLPNVAFAHKLNDADLVALLNYVMFDLGGAQRTAVPYTEAEIAAARIRPIVTGNLESERIRAWRAVSRTCDSRSNP